MLSAARSQTVLFDPTGAQCSITFPSGPTDNDELTLIATNWNFATSAGPTAVPGPPSQGGGKFTAPSGVQVQDPINNGAYSAVAGNVFFPGYGTVTYKFHAGNQTWFKSSAG